MSLHTWAELRPLTPQQIRARFGGKALGLFEAHQLGIALPATFLLDVSHHRAFLESHPPEEPGAFQLAALPFIRERLGFALDSLEEGRYAVRSSCQEEDSAHHSFAGIFETKLDVPREEIAAAIASVWSSPLQARAREYSQHRSLMGVLLQPMIEAKFAGVCFTKHPSPSTLFEEHSIVVEFAPTSGEKVVQGEVIPFRLSGTPDLLSLTSESGWMDDLLLAIFALKKHSHHETDIEFVIDATDNFWLLQQRPISRRIPTQTLDLARYRRMYKRSLFALDAELLIDGCSRFLAPYLEVPMNLERWMVMTTRETQELWVDEVLNEAVLSAMVEKLERDPTYLPRIEARYADHHRRLCHTPLPSTLFEWFEWITPFTAHYYAPMFAIEALYTSILRAIRPIDPEHAERDLFELSSVGVSSMLDPLYRELRPLHALSYEDALPHLLPLTKRFGFLKCRQVTEEPYTARELFEMIEQIPSERPHVEDAAKRQRYFHQEHLAQRLQHLRTWMRIRNQEMEFLLFAFLQARPLIEATCQSLSIDRETFWRSSSAALLKALASGAPLVPTPVAHLTILQRDGRPHLTDRVEVRWAEMERLTDLKGRTVYGKGILEATVYIAFSVEEIREPPSRPCVLVTGMTTPDFVPLIHKYFDALITDEGGILCHAAIVAREIPIACIVGTSSATTRLRPGDTIRIDFDRGEIEQIAPSGGRG